MSDESVIPMIKAHIPDENLVAAIGCVTLWHSHLDHALRMTIKSLTGVDASTAISATRRQQSAHLRRRIEFLAKSRFGEGSILVQVQDLMNRCERITHRRNQLTHNIVAEEVREDQEGRKMALTDDLEWVDIPTLEDILELVEDLKQMNAEVHHVRLRGWLASAINATAKK